MAWLLSLTPFLTALLVLTLLEWRLCPSPSDWWRNLQSGVLSLLAGLLAANLFANGWMPSLLDGASLQFWIACPLFFLIRDLGEFLYHRAQHKVPLLWAMHSLHHSDPNMSALTTQRHFWADTLVKAFTIWALAALILAPTPAIFAAYSAASIWNLVAHSRLPVDLGRWSWLINSPAYHRRHHSRLPEHYNSNFAGLFPIFDVICGTYRRPDGFPPTGLDRKPESLIDLLVWPVRHAGAPTPVETAMAPVR